MTVCRALQDMTNVLATLFLLKKVKGVGLKVKGIWGSLHYFYMVLHLAMMTITGFFPGKNTYFNLSFIGKGSLMTFKTKINRNLS